MWNRQEHVSRWPKYDLKPEEKLRPVGVWKHEHCCVVTADGEVIPYISATQFIKAITELRLIVFTYRSLSKVYFSPLEELMEDKRVHVYVTRTQQVSGIYIKSKYSAWIVERRIWDDSVKYPDLDFLKTISHVFDVNNRSAATPGALGELKIRETLPGGTRFNRPNTPIRRRLLANKTGGRADTIEEKKHYGVLYEQDLNSSYPYVAMETVDPAEHPKRFGTGKSVISAKLLSKFFSYFVHAIVVTPLDKEVKFGPLSTRDAKGRLRWITERGKSFDGWYWKEELDRARDAGYDVTITEGYGWKRSSTWLKLWAEHMFKLKGECNGPAKDIIKRETVAALGRFGIAPETLTLVKEEDYQKGDLPITISDARAWESPHSGYYIHITPNPDANHLTHISSYIVARARCELYDRLLAEESTGNSVVASNYDSLYTLEPTRLKHRVGKGIGEWKQRAISEAYIYGPRSIKGIREGIPIDIRPGVDRTTRDGTKATHMQHNSVQKTKRSRSQRKE